MAVFADKVQMQNRLFAELSSMFGKEVPLYDKALLVNKVCNTCVCSLLGKKYPGFSISEAQLEKTSGERHGAIRIGRPDEYRWIARFFHQFAMEPHNFYDMANVGAKSQPIIATAFRSVLNPEHRVFTSLLLTDYFDEQTRSRIEKLLATRNVFSDRAKQLIEKGEKQGGLDDNDANELIREATQRIFKWTGKARDYRLYKDLCDAGFKIAADIACFESHHLNHLTPNTFSMDLYTAAMKFCMGELPESDFRKRATTTLSRLRKFADRDFMKLHFKHLTREQIDALPMAEANAGDVASLVESLTKRLSEPDLQLSKLKHAGFKDFTEGPSQDTPVLLRQDAYKALTERVTFTNPDGTVVDTTHTARFGEIEQRFYATTPAGRDLYDKCLTQNDAQRDKDPSIVKRDFAAYESQSAGAFAPFPKTLRELAEKNIVYGRFAPTAKGLAANGSVQSTDMRDLVSQGFAQIEGLRYEDFLPVSAAGIFASNLNQYGTKATAAERPVYTKARLEEIMGRKIIESDAVYQGIQARSMLDTYDRLGLLGKIPPAQRTELESQAAAVPE
ncbi:MAG: VOC family protein [Phycisphaeraceae bacterium]|nr:VOC family protein [Phycisphaeraceae bacterium]